MRRWHRWAAIPAGVLMIFISLTGVLLHLDMMRVGQSPPGHENKPRVAAVPLPDNATLAAMVTKVADAARAQPGLKVESIQVSLTAGRVVVSAGGTMPGTPQLKFDGTTGQAITEPPRPADFHYVLQDIHAGYFAGWPGRIVSVLCGIALILLSITGLQMWWDMRKRRRKQGLWWK